MIDDADRDWESRLARLERANEELTRRCRAWRRGTWTALGVVGVVALLGAAVAVPATLEANNFVLRDAQGRMRAALAVRPDGSPALGFFDEDGHPRISMELGGTGPSVNLLDGAGRPRAAMALRADGTPGVGLFDPAGRVRTALDLGVGGTAGLNFYETDGSLRAALAIRPDGTPALGFFDELGQPQVSVEQPVAAPAPRRITPGS